MLELFEDLGAPAKGRFVGALALSAAAGASGVLLLGLSGWFLTAAALAGLAGLGHAFNHLYPSAGVRGFAFSRVLTRYGEQLVGHDATLRLSAKLRPMLFAAGARTGRGFAPMPGDALSALIDDVETVEAGFLRVISPFAAILASICVALGFVLAADLLTAGLTFVALFIAGWFLPRRAVKASRTSAENLSAAGEDMRGQLTSLVENAVELDVNGALGKLARNMGDQLLAFEQDRERLEKPFHRLGAINAALGGALAMLLLVRGLGEDTGLAICAGGALALLAAFDALGAMAKVLDAAPRAEKAVENIRARLNVTDAVPQPSVEEAVRLDTVFPVTADNLRVQAADSAPLSVPVSFTLTPGSVTLLSGPSGCGKTTLIETLMRLHPPAEGSLFYAGKNWAECRSAAVLAHIAAAPQFAAFLPGTIRNQFRLANVDITDEDIWQALETAGLAALFRRRHLTLDTELGEALAGLSGGEARRLGLARALVTDAEILVLDEPFAGLEPALAREIAGNLIRWTAARNGALVIAQHEDLVPDWAQLNVQKVNLEPA